MCRAFVLGHTRARAHAPSALLSYSLVLFVTDFFPERTRILLLLKIIFFSDMSPCNLVGLYRRFGVTCDIHNQSRWWIWRIPLKPDYTTSCHRRRSWYRSDNLDSLLILHREITKAVRDLRFSQRCCWSFRSSEMWYCSFGCSADTTVLQNV